MRGGSLGGQTVLIECRNRISTCVLLVTSTTATRLLTRRTTRPLALSSQLALEDIHPLLFGSALSSILSQRTHEGTRPNPEHTQTSQRNISPLFLTYPQRSHHPLCHWTPHFALTRPQERPSDPSIRACSAQMGEARLIPTLIFATPPSGGGFEPPKPSPRHALNGPDGPLPLPVPQPVELVQDSAVRDEDLGG